MLQEIEFKDWVKDIIKTFKNDILKSGLIRCDNLSNYKNEYLYKQVYFEHISVRIKTYDDFVVMETMVFPYSVNKSLTLKMLDKEL